MASSIGMRKKREMCYWAGFVVFLLTPALLPVAMAQQGTPDDPLIEQTREDMLRVGRAIEEFYRDRGILLVDFEDQKTPEGQARLAGPLENVGNPSDRERTARDIFLPLVHFGYLDELPENPFPTADEEPLLDSFLYIDEEADIPGDDTAGKTPGGERLLAMGHTENHWRLLTPGPNGHFGGFEEVRARDNIVVSRIDVLTQPPYVDDLVAKVHEDLLKIGRAIEQLRTEKGVLLIDGWDDDQAVGRERLQTVFEGVGDVPEAQRLSHHVLAPLAHFGYLDEVPMDPFARYNPASSTQSDSYWYSDNDPLLPGNDYGTGGVLRSIPPDPPLEPGEWIIMSAGPNVSDESLYIEGIAITLRSDELDAPVASWELY